LSGIENYERENKEKRKRYAVHSLLFPFLLDGHNTENEKEQAVQKEKGKRL
jgi:hypothetical protein